MKDILNEIKDGTFAQNWINENNQNQNNFKRLMNDDLNHPIEEVGKKLRGHMDWLEN